MVATGGLARGNLRVSRILARPRAGGVLTTTKVVVAGRWLELEVVAQADGQRLRAGALGDAQAVDGKVIVGVRAVADSRVIAV